MVKFWMERYSCWTEIFEAEMSHLPRTGEFVVTPSGQFTVVSIRHNFEDGQQVVDIYVD